MPNIVDPDETARYEPPHQDVQCLQKWFDLQNKRHKRAKRTSSM